MGIASWVISSRNAICKLCLWPTADPFLSRNGKVKHLDQVISLHSLFPYKLALRLGRVFLTVADINFACEKSRQPFKKKIHAETIVKKIVHAPCHYTQDSSGQKGSTELYVPASGNFAPCRDETLILLTVYYFTHLYGS